VIDEMTFIMAHTVENRCLKFHGKHSNTSAYRLTEPNWQLVPLSS
jgi:hypothetical protein